MNIYYIIGGIAIILLIGLLIYLLTHKKEKEPREYILVVTFKNGFYHDLSSDEMFFKLGEFQKHGDEFFVKTRLNEVRLKKEIGKLLETDLANICVIIKRW